jgi:hypothetical protein
MILTLVRNIPESTKDYTIGELYVQEEDKLTQTYKVCDTLEDAFRLLPKACPNTPKGSSCECKEKVYGKTCIPNGTYTVVLSYSNRFKRILPELLNVPHFLGIRIHSGNSSKDTEGCIILGTKSKGDWVTASRVAFNKVYKLLQDAVTRKEEITITIR